MIDPVTGMLIGTGVSALGGLLGSSSAAKKQEEAAKEAQELARRNYLAGLQINEPTRFTGNQALNEINSVFGYQSSPYTSMQQLVGTATPMSSRNVAKALKNGMSYEQIQQMGGTLAGRMNPKSMRRLTKAGLTPEQIMGLSAGRQGQTMGAPAVAQQQGPTGMAAFQASPDYQFRLNEGQRDMGNSFAARGGAASGNALRALTTFNQGMASGEFGNWFNRRMDLVDGGSRSAAATQNAGNQYAQGAGNAIQAQGDARASGIMGGVNAVNGAIGNGLNAWAWNQYGRQSPGGYSGGSGTTPNGGYGGYGIGGIGGGALPFQPGSWDQLNYPGRP
jgi:hypothetical protein